MENQEIEKILQESADNIQGKDFEKIWEQIEGRVIEEKKKRRKKWINIAAASAASIVLMCAIVIPIVLNQLSNESKYTDDQLTQKAVELEEFHTSLFCSNIEFVDISEYEISLSYVLNAPDNKTKGGIIEFSDNLNSPNFFLIVNFYTNDVEVIRDKVVYDFNYSTNGATVEYRLEESYPKDGIYIYDIKANFKSVNYYMEYTCFTEDIKPFLDEFFS